MRKYNIVYVSVDYKVSIIDTFLTHKDALEKLSSLINEDYKSEENQKYYKIYYENNNEISIFYIGYLTKSFYCKYFIIPYEDKTDLKFSDL